MAGRNKISVMDPYLMVWTKRGRQRGYSTENGDDDKGEGTVVMNRVGRWFALPANLTSCPHAPVVSPMPPTLRFKFLSRCIRVTV